MIQGVTIDGKRGVAKAFGNIPVQMCHFHQVAIIKRYLTSRPKLEASIELLKLCRRIPTSTQSRFTDALSQWHGKHKTFLEEKTINPYHRKTCIYTCQACRCISEPLNQSSLFIYLQKLQRVQNAKYNQCVRWRSILSSQKTHKIASGIG